MPRPSIYLSHPLPSFKTPTSSARLRALRRAFPHADIVDAAALYNSNEEWLERYRGEIAKSSALVFFPYRGTVGYGVYCELVAAEDLGLPTLLLSGGKLYNTWVLAILHHRHQWKRFARVQPRGHPVDPAEVVLAPPRARALPSGALGRIIENRVIEYLLVLSDGRLIVYRPESDFGGTDLFVSLTHGKAVLKLQVKGRTKESDGRFLRVGVKATQIPLEDPKLLVFVQYDLRNAELAKFAWVVPSGEYRAKARLKFGYYKADLATGPTSQDRWVDCRYNTKDLAWVVEERLKRSS